MKNSKIVIARATAVVVALSAIATIAGDSLLFSGQPFFEQYWQLQSSEWVSAHSLIIALLLLYIAWSLWQRSRNAWRIVTVLVVIEFARSATVLGSQFITFTYGVLILILILSRSAFDKKHTTTIFRKRLGRVAFIVIATAVIVSAVSASFHYYQTKQWGTSSLSANKVIVKTLLLDQSTDQNDPQIIKLFSNLLFITGVFMYVWILSALFLPTLLDQLSHHDKESAQKIEDLLDAFSTDSEDSFKLWPTDKLYWSSPTHDAVVAYKQQGKFAFALADPICDPQYLGISIKQFNDFCRSHGATASWILVDGQKRSFYESAGLSLITIGASAMVSVNEFSNSTVNDKWWRWVRNKSSKQGYTYKILSTPLSQDIVQQLARVSDSWIHTNKYTERTFAIGYFDSSFLQKCTIHTLVDSKGSIVAFANQLPNYNDSKCATIDLMRSLPEAKGAMALLLSEIVLHLHNQGNYTYFDLGFVPLSNKHKDTDNSAQTLLRKAVRPVYSIEGLEQFKSKFDPAWHAKYIAWDGDKLLVPQMTTALLRALSK